MKNNVAILISNGCIRDWQRAALSDVTDLIDVRLVLDCQNTVYKRKPFKLFLYYIFNFLTVRRGLNRSKPFSLPGVRTLSFDAPASGAWQSLPTEVVTVLKEAGIDFIIRFGMPFIKIEPAYSDIPILSYHHGDPAYYRGGPEAFYEMLANEESCGIIVQSLCDKREQGEIYALAYSRIVHHSHYATTQNLYKNSTPLLRKAILNLRANEPILHAKDGKKHCLPSNSRTFRYLLTLFWRKIRRGLYGAFIQKYWNIALIKTPDWRPEEDRTISLEGVSTPPLASDYVFYADPVFVPGRSYLRVEGFNKKTGKGDILKLDHEFNLLEVEFSGAHYSYPFSFFYQEREFVMPEIAEHSSPAIFECLKAGFEKIPLKGLEHERLVDGNLFFHEGVWYLFANRLESSADNLCLFFAPSPFDTFVAHPQNPVVIDPGRARMAGPIIELGGKIYRVGQNNTRTYGESVKLCEVIMLNPKQYRERELQTIAVDGAKGPHMVVYKDGCLLIDYYHEKFSLLAGYRRFIGRFF